MRSLVPFAALSLFPFPLAAQDAPAAAAQAPAAQAPALQLPAAGSPEATALFVRACNRMLAAGSGTFRTDEEQDSAIMRGQNLPGGLSHDPPSIRGGWSSDLLWAETDDDTFATRNGATVAKTDGGWKLRARTLASGAQRPFVLSPTLLFTQLAKLPVAQQGVMNVEAGEAGGKPVAILALSFTGPTADDLALGGALPATGGAFLFGGLPGGSGAPEKTYTVDLALFVEPTSGDVLRLRAKVYEDNPMLANMRIRFGGGGGGDGDADEPAAKTPAAATTAAPVIKKGLPERTPGGTESVAYLKADFKDLGSAKPPSIDDAGKSWLGIK